MKSDAIVIGSELDGLIAALRLAEDGRQVRLIAPGAGSLHYAPGGIHLLGYRPGDVDPILTDPFAEIDTLAERHPYQVVGPSRVRQALDWFLSDGIGDAADYRTNGGNTLMVTPAGLEKPCYAWPTAQAAFDDLTGKRVAIICFKGYQDLPAGLLNTALKRRGISSAIIGIDPPTPKTDSAGLARALDDLAVPETYFSGIKNQLSDHTEVAIFPAVLGFIRHREILRAAETALGLRCFEVPTLPPSIPGMRLYRYLMLRLRRSGAAVHLGTQIAEPVCSGTRITAVRDDAGRVYNADVFIAATGGVLMGGLGVDTSGIVHETRFGLGVHQTQPLEMERIDRALDALHETGVETDRRLRPLANGAPQFENLFVTGTTLAHWRPMCEASAEGVAIATGWTAAEEARALLEG